MVINTPTKSRSRSSLLKLTVALATAALLGQVMVGSVVAAYDASKCTTSADGAGQACVDVTYTLGSGNVRLVSKVTGWIVTKSYGSGYFTVGQLTIFYNTGTYQDQFPHQVNPLTVYSHAVSFSPALQVAKGTCYEALWSGEYGLLMNGPTSARVCLS